MRKTSKLLVFFTILLVFPNITLCPETSSNGTATIALVPQGGGGSGSSQPWPPSIFPAAPLPPVVISPEGEVVAPEISIRGRGWLFLGFIVFGPLLALAAVEEHEKKKRMKRARQMWN
jgi:hypothetical protein